LDFPACVHETSGRVTLILVLSGWLALATMSVALCGAAADGDGAHARAEISPQ
jgi:hypothetical protein